MSICNPYHVERRRKAGCLMPYMGVSITDIAMAGDAAVRIIAVDFGYTDIPVRDLDVDQVIGAFAELPAAVNPLLGQPVGNL